MERYRENYNPKRSMRELGLIALALFNFGLVRSEIIRRTEPVKAPLVVSLSQTDNIVTLPTSEPTPHSTPVSTQPLQTTIEQKDKNCPSGGGPEQNKALAKCMADNRQLSQDQWVCIKSIIDNENKSWNHLEVYPAGGSPYEVAYGLPQAKKGKKMRLAGTDWLTNPKTQLKWMYDIYIPDRYGSPCSAWSFWQKHKHY